jgi:hypothetical protein
MRVSRRRFFGLLGAAAAVASPVGRALAKMPEVAPDPAAVIGQWADYYHYSNINFMSPISPELLATQKIANGTMNAQLDMIRMPFRTRQGNLVDEATV